MKNIDTNKRPQSAAPAIRNDIQAKNLLKKLGEKITNI